MWYVRKSRTERETDKDTVADPADDLHTCGQRRVFDPLYVRGLVKLTHRLQLLTVGRRYEVGERVDDLIVHLGEQNTQIACQLRTDDGDMIQIVMYSRPKGVSDGKTIVDGLHEGQLIIGSFAELFDALLPAH